MADKISRMLQNNLLMRRLFSHDRKIIIGCLFAISLFIFSCSSDSPVNGDKSYIKSTQQSKSYNALQLGEELHESFSIGVTKCQDSADEILPSYFGGSYSDSDDNLIVLIKNLDKKGKDDICNRIGKHDNLKCKRCTYSLCELRTLKRKLSDIYINDEALRKNLKWNSVGISVEENRIVVFLEDISTETIHEFKRLVSDSPMIIFND